ncbi:MAG TPA: DMT family transporter [Feifaniaceae bacterium]|nr:DMT family transporter [Feifaniaceae bacterium]
MNKLEANLALLSVAFFWGIQYVFFSALPEGISTFAFMTLTCAIGCLLVAAVFWRELWKFTKQLAKKSFITAVFLFASNMLLTYGSRSLEPAVSGFFAAAYIVFVPLVLRLFKQKVTRSSLAGMALVVAGLLPAAGFGFTGSLTNGIFPVLVSDVLFAVYLVMVDRAAGDVNPVLLSMGQMGFSALFSLAGWVLFQPSTLLRLPADAAFWESVLMVAVFIRAFTTVMQVYAQRYVSAMNTCLVLSTETVFALFTAPLLASLTGGSAAPFTLPKLLGCAALVCGVLISGGIIRLPVKRKEEVGV